MIPTDDDEINDDIRRMEEDSEEPLAYTPISFLVSQVMDDYFAAKARNDRSQLS